ncbi:MAG: ABC transporter ATP-binding protein [Phycisphaerae bacterium]
MMDCVLEIRGMSKAFDGVKALASFSCSVREKEILGLIGPNGAGKTTCFNVVSGLIPPDSGQVMFRGQDLVGLPPHQIARSGIARTFQILRLVRRLSVLENVLLAFQDQPGERLRNVFFRPTIGAKKEAENREMAVCLLDEVGLAENQSMLADELSYGQQKLLSLICCLSMGAELLLLDEPVAGIAPEMTEKIIGLIRGLPAKRKSVVLIEHNLDAVTRICDRVIFMDAGTNVCEGTAEEVRRDPRVIEAYLD